MQLYIKHTKLQILIIYKTYFLKITKELSNKNFDTNNQAEFCRLFFTEN